MDSTKVRSIGSAYGRSFGGHIEPKRELAFAVLELCGEAGELANYAKKEWRSGGLKDYTEEMAMEVADVAILCHGVADMLGCQLDELVEQKLQVLKDRTAGNISAS